MSLKVSVSGVRGIWADSLDMETIFRYSLAFACYVRDGGGKKVLLARDGRPTGDVMGRFAASVLNMMGLDVVDAGIVPTPTVLFGVRECGFDAGLMLSASHNPLEWNAFKFVKKGGIFTDDADLKVIKKFLADPMGMPKWQNVGQYTEDNSVMYRHIQAVLKAVDVELIKNARLKVLLDPVNCSGCMITKMLFEELNVSAVYVNDDPHGYFSRPAEPTPDHLKHFHELIVIHQADIGFAQDPDADRLVVADERGRVLSEEMTPVLALKTLLDRGEYGDIVLNMSTSSISEKMIKPYAQSFRSKVGEANVVQKIKEVHAFYGLEGNGGVIYPEVNAGRDSLVGIALILELLARERKPLSKIIALLPQTVMKKEKYNFDGNLSILLQKIKQIFPGVEVNEEDGLRLDTGDLWIHIRSSNTEPVLRVIAEGTSETLLNQTLETIQDLIKENIR